MKFEDLNLEPEVLQGLDAMNFKEATPVQEATIPVVLDGKDLIACAQTGTGKTAAYILPLLNLLTRRPSEKDLVRAIVIAPTRELAQQIDMQFEGFSYFLPISTFVVAGGGDGAQWDQQKRGLQMGADVMIATPGRLISHLLNTKVDLSGVEYLVLDEADRMLDMGFIRDIRKILALVPKARQTLLLSATFNDEIHALAQSILTDPVDIEIAKNKDCALVHQEEYLAAKKRKRDLLRDLIVDNDWEQVLVFTRMKHAANRLAEQLAKDGLTSAAIHGNKSQSARTKALSGFKNKTIRVLVATDIAARGLDIKDLPQVVNYELPNVPEDYVHRIGRTGRAGQTGLAVSLVSPEETSELKAVERLLKKKLTVKTAPGYEKASPSDAEEIESPRKRAQSKHRHGPKRPVPVRDKKTTQSPEKVSFDKKPRKAPAKTFGKKSASVRWEKPSLTGKTPSKTHSPKARKKDTLNSVARQTKSTLQKDLRFETVRSNLPPGMPISRLKRHRS